MQHTFEATFERALVLAATTSLAGSERDLLSAAEEALAMAHESKNALAEQQALMLVTLAHYKLGQIDEALHAAAQALARSDQNGEQQATFHRACTLAAAAKAMNAGGQPNQAMGLILQALDLAEQLDEEERKGFDRLFGEG